MPVYYVRGRILTRAAIRPEGTIGMWRTVIPLVILCGIFEALLISLSIIGLKI